jgi:hypothetical protein
MIPPVGGRHMGPTIEQTIARNRTIFLFFGPFFFPGKRGDRFKSSFQMPFGYQEKPDPCQTNPSRVGFLNFEFYTGIKHPEKITKKE